MPASSRTGFLLLAEAKPIRSDSNTSVITYLRTEGGCAERIPAREERSENMGTTMQTPSKFKYYLYLESVLPVKVIIAEESERVTSVGTWHPAWVNPLHQSYAKLWVGKNQTCKKNAEPRKYKKMMGAEIITK
ncbi:hypothetical protein BTVI_147630 [Pitangus sulphuratus]|nr:hypothetical protein BTVI_147630 [Pitangus sulphuratus]